MTFPCPSKISLQTNLQFAPASPRQSLSVPHSNRRTRTFNVSAEFLQFPRKFSSDNMVHEVKNKEDFDSKLAEAGGKLVVVDFFATWCGPCKMIAPKIEEMSKNNADVVFLKVDVDECEDIAAEYQISAMPTFVFIKNGKKVHDFSGANEQTLKDKIAELK